MQQSSAHSLCTQLAPSLSLWPGLTPGSGAPVAAGNQFLPAASQGQDNSERAALEVNHLLTLYLPSQPLLQALLKVRRWRCALNGEQIKWQLKSCNGPGRGWGERCLFKKVTEPSPPSLGRRADWQREKSGERGIRKGWTSQGHITPCCPCRLTQLKASERYFPRAWSTCKKQDSNKAASIVLECLPPLHSWSAFTMCLPHACWGSGVDTHSIHSWSHLTLAAPPTE